MCLTTPVIGIQQPLRNSHKSVQHSPLLNNTKWDELRLAMHNLGNSSPRWRTRDIETEYVSDWDGDWYYRFPAGGYETIEWVEIEVTSDEQKSRVLEELRSIHLPGRESVHGFLIVGYSPTGGSVDYV